MTDKTQILFIDVNGSDIEGIDSVVGGCTECGKRYFSRNLAEIKSELNFHYRQAHIRSDFSAAIAVQGLRDPRELQQEFSKSVEEAREVAVKEVDAAILHRVNQSPCNQAAIFAAVTSPGIDVQSRIRALEEEGLIYSSGAARNRKYQLK